MAEAGEKKRREQQTERAAACGNDRGERQQQRMIIRRLGQYERWQKEIIKESMWTLSKNPGLQGKQSLQSMAILAICIIWRCDNEAVADNRL